MFRVKICGVRLEKDVLDADRAGADAVGLNFFPPSIRFVDPSDRLTQALSRMAAESGLLRVGVFVNEKPGAIETVAQQVGLDAVQLHGDEPVETAETLAAAGYRVARAIKLPRQPFSVSQLQEQSERWLACGCHLLLDVDAGRSHGGSGKTLHWESVAAWAAESRCRSWTLAGGLRPENVGQAMRVSGATSVDTASGVECPRGVKHPDRVRAFVEAAMAALADG